MRYCSCWNGQTNTASYLLSLLFTPSHQSQSRVFFLCCFVIASNLLLQRPHFLTDKAGSLILEVVLSLKVWRAGLSPVCPCGERHTHCTMCSRIHPAPQLYYPIYLLWLLQVLLWDLLAPTGEPQRWRRLWLYPPALLSVSSSGTLWSLQTWVTVRAEGNRTPRPASGRSALVSRSRVSSAAQPSWLKGCVHLVSLMGVISGSGSKHSAYKIKHECIKVMPGACLLPVLLSAWKKGRHRKETLKVAIFFICQLPLFVSNISHV